MIALVLLGLAALASAQECLINMNGDLPRGKSPLFFETSGQLVLPKPHGKTGYLHMPSGHQLLLACPGNKNSIAKAHQPMLQAQCEAGNRVNINGQSASVADLACSKTAASSLRGTPNQCDAGGFLVELGFEVGPEWIKMVDLCHQVDQGNTLWAKHTVHGGALAGAEVESKRPSFSRGDKALFAGYNPDTMYKQATHKAMLARVLGKERAEQLMGNTFIARGHLAPDADFIFGSWQFLTYFYANAAPQWQSINAGNWLAVEKLVRKKAEQMGRDLTVYTGTEGILTIDGIPLYLNDAAKKMPIPDNFWKVLYDPATQQGVAIIGSNNPERSMAQPPLCENICEQVGWRTMANDVRKGLVYCCTVDAFRAAVPHAPALPLAGGVLPGPMAVPGETDSLGAKTDTEGDFDMGIDA